MAHCDATAGPARAHCAGRSPGEAGGLDTFPQGWTSEGHWHTSPVLRFIVILTGGLEIAVGSGEARVFGPGSVLRLDDVHAGGDLTGNVADGETQATFVQLEDGG